MPEEGKPIQRLPKPGQLPVDMNGPDIEGELLTASYCLLAAQRHATDHARLKGAMLATSECMGCVDIAALSDQSRSQPERQLTAPSSPLFKTSTRLGKFECQVTVSISQGRWKREAQQKHEMTGGG